MQVLNFSESLSALEGYIKEYNGAAEGLKEQVRQPVADTARAIVLLYGRYLAVANDLEPIDPSDLPPLRTSNVQLAGRCHCSDRTVRRHILKLLDAGVITGKAWHGTNSSIELWINPKLLWISLWTTENVRIQGHIVRTEETAHTTQKGGSEDAERTSCPHYNKGYLNNKKNNIISAVENPVMSAHREETGDLRKRRPLSRTSLLDSTGNTVTGHAGEKVKGNSIEVAGEKARAGSSKMAPVGTKDSSGAGRSASLYAEDLWRVARQQLYPDTYLSPWQVREAKRLIPRFYETVPQERLQSCHIALLERVGMAKDYVGKGKGRFVLLPHQYFDRENPNGFAGTKEWWTTRYRKVREDKLDRALRQQLAKMDKIELGRDRRDVFRECEQTLSKLGDKGTLDRFYREVLSPAVYERLV